MDKKTFYLTQILIFVFSLTRFTYFNIPIVEIKENDFLVVEVYQKYAVLENEGIRFLYYVEDVERGNTLKIDYSISLLNSDNDFYKYLNSQKIFYLVEGEVLYNDGYVSYNEKLINSLLENKDNENKAIIKLILFNKKDDTNSDFYNYFENFSITFLLVISGFHINLLLRILNKRGIIKYLVVFSYLYLLNFSVSSFRAFLYYVIKKINKRAKFILNNSDILSLIMISFLFFNPSYCFNKGFIYSFAFSYIMDFLNNSISSKNIKSSIAKKILIFSFSVPIILNDSYQLNTNSFLVSLLFQYIISFLFIFSLLYLFLDKFYLVYKLYIYFVKLLLGFFQKYSINLVFGKPSSAMIVVMYLLLIVVVYFYQNKLYKRVFVYYLLFVFVNMFQYNLAVIDSREQVYFIDVGQGDCTILKIKNSKKVVLIDTGGSRYRDLANDVIIPFLKSKGINTIENIIITHDDYDHGGCKDDLVNNFKINLVTESSSIESVFVGEKEFINLNINDGRDNDGSIVLYGEYGNLNYLFTGDVSIKIEQELIKNKKLGEVDILKVGHHGSNTSTSEEFLASIRPKVALIGVSQNNFYGHPSKDVIERLEKFNIAVYRTDIDGNITIYKSRFNNKIVIESD